MMLIRRMPTKNIITLHILEFDIFPVLNNTYPTIRLNKPHKTFTVGDDKPLPGGLANGVGKATPDIPLIK